MKWIKLNNNDMEQEKDIRDFLILKKNLELKLEELNSKENLLPAEEIIREEVIYELGDVNSKIEKY